MKFALLLLCLGCGPRHAYIACVQSHTDVGVTIVTTVDPMTLTPSTHPETILHDVCDLQAVFDTLYHEIPNTRHRPGTKPPITEVP